MHISATIKPNPSDCRFRNADGAPLSGITSGTITFGIGEPARIQLNLVAVAAEIDGLAKFFVPDPTTGAPKAVRRILFEDGSTFPPSEPAA